MDTVCFCILKTTGTVYTWVHKVCDAAGLPHRTVHSLRHTNITMQIAAVRRTAGHSGR